MARHISHENLHSAEASQPFPSLGAEHETLNESVSAAYLKENINPVTGHEANQVQQREEEDEEDEEEEVEDEEEPEEDADFLSHYSYGASSPSEDSNSSEDDTSIHQPFPQSPGVFAGPHTFAPPFYNRPPTPLPPSPSLTSLLRPPFSTTTSHPTTPDSSDVETLNDTEAAVAKSARDATTVPRASPKVPTYEYYGFVLYLASSFAFLIYLLWSYLPSPFLHQLGIYYYPNRWWSLAIPSFLVMTLVYIYVALAAYNTGYLTLPMNSIENLVDDAANIAVIDSKGRRRAGGSEKMNPGSTTAQTMGSQKRKLAWKHTWNEGTDAVMDIPIGGVCEVLYGNDDMDESDSSFPHDPRRTASGRQRDF